MRLSGVARGFAATGSPAKLFAAATVMAALLQGVLMPASASAFAPIEGVWEVTTPPNAHYLIQEVSPEHFQERSITGENGCFFDSNGFVNPVGQFAGEDIGGGLEYSGYRVVYNEGCEREAGAQALAVDKIFSTDPANYRKRVCVAALGAGPPSYTPNFEPTSSTTHCSEAVRIAPPLPPVTLSQITTLPPQPGCTAAAQRHGRKIKLRLKNPVNEPLLSATVKLGGQTVLTYQYPASVPKQTTIRLPGGPKLLTVSLVTTSGKTFTKKRRYGPCRRSKAHHRHHHRG